MAALSSLDLVSILSELEEWHDSRVNKISQQGPELRFELIKGRRTRLDIHAGERLHLTEYSKTYPPAKGMCMLLRKRVEGGILKKIEQHEFDRVVVLTFEKRDVTYHLVAELFAKGNLIFCDADFKIIQPWKVEFWKGRAVKPKADYKFPPSGPNLKLISKDEFEKKLKSSEKEIAPVLARGLGLGRYADEVCVRAKLEKDKPASKLTKSEREGLFKTVQKLLKDSQKPKPFKAGEEVFPFKMKSDKGELIQASFNQAVDEIYSKGEAEEAQQEADAKKESKVDKAKIRLEQLEAKIKEFEEGSVEAEAKANLIYKHNVELAEMLQKIVKANKEGQSWDSIEKAFGIKVKKNEGKIIVELA